MKKKSFIKKIATLSLSIIAMLTSSPAIASAASVYDASVIDTAEYFSAATDYSNLQDNPFLTTKRTFGVSKTEDDSFTYYKINVNGTPMEVHVPKDEDEHPAPKNISDVPNKVQDVITSSRNLVFDYIDASDILEDKQEIKDFLSELPIKEADYDDDSESGALFYPEDEGIYINRLNEEYVCEWMLVHEYFHAIAYFTNGYTVGEYGYTFFTEFLTDTLTSSLDPAISEGIESAYSQQATLIYPYIALAGEKAISAYFYGYDDSIYRMIQKVEFDFWIIVLQNYGTNLSDVYYNNLIFKWYATAVA